MTQDWVEVPQEKKNYTYQHKYGQMNSTMTLLKPLNNPNLLLPYEQYYIQSLHHEGKLIPEQNPGEINPLFQTVINPHIPLEQTSSASACIRIPHHHNATPTHIEPDMCKLIYKTSEYVQETSKTYHTQRQLNNHKTTHQPTFTETRFLKQPRTSRLNTRH